MPTYEYLCKQCGDRFDVFQSFSDRPLSKHDDCGGELQKVFHARGIVFKGDGFYATDGRGKSNSSKPAATDAKKAKKDPKPKAATPSSGE
jgi:putative FmdB family regulatory protein